MSNQFEVGNQAATRHGGAIARKHLSEGTPFPEGSPARLAELAIEDRYQMDGRGSLIHSNARRIQAVADLYTQEFFEAAKNGDKARRDGYAKIMLWAIRLSNSAWEADRQEQASVDDGAIEAAYHSAKGKNGDDPHVD